MSTVVPETSIYLMKIFLANNKANTFGIQDEFNSKVQTMDLEVTKLLNAPGSHLSNFFIWLFENPCQTMLSGSSPNC